MGIPSIRHAELLTRDEVMGWLQIGEKSYYKHVRPYLPPQAIVRFGVRGRNMGPRNEKVLIFAWAIWRLLGVEQCPGCGQNWPEETHPIPKEYRRGPRTEAASPTEVPSRRKKSHSPS